ncbi:cupin domain-containing protein [Sessilibacter corallicola]|uniref:cupin domain-containing protein n=1 Tax=Sessilibacter corallicola TaxID=2904075 RepID=UPI001E44FFE7|nr:cupin domain-containing protein [Sessilibacter corallicola]MCE2028660.1 cupin domain-containing protein [Sessilibacter corallicola]
MYQVSGELLIQQLPPLLSLNEFSKDTEQWIESTLRFIDQEARELKPDGETTITRLADILIIQLIRQ